MQYDIKSVQYYQRSIINFRLTFLSKHKVYYFILFLLSSYVFLRPKLCAYPSVKNDINLSFFIERIQRHFSAVIYFQVQTLRSYADSKLLLLQYFFKAPKRILYLSMHLTYRIKIIFINCISFLLDQFLALNTY